MCVKVQVSQNVIGYLPNIDAPACDMATVYEVMVHRMQKQLKSSGDKVRDSKISC